MSTIILQLRGQFPDESHVYFLREILGLETTYLYCVSKTNTTYIHVKFNHLQNLIVGLNANILGQIRIQVLLRYMKENLRN